MKNQYFGDINDYRKYGILRALHSGSDLPLAVCWMLTPDDGGADGRKVAYLHKPDRWRNFDPAVFDELQAALLEDRRSIRVADQTFLGSAKSFPQILGHREADRADYFSTLLAGLADSGLVFFDPDNGMEVKSKPINRRGAEKYLFWNELEGVFNEGHSCLVYQHFRRVPRVEFSEALSLEFHKRLGARWVATLRTKNVLFLLAPQQGHEESLAEGLRRVERSWGAETIVTFHDEPRETATPKAQVLRPGTGFANISPFTFHRYAVHFLHGAKGFEKPDDGHSPVPYFLASRALELVLKAFLSARGMEKVMLKKEYRHNLHRLFNAARKEGIEEVVALPPDAEHLIQKANSFYDDDKGFEYFRLKDAGGGYRDLPDLAHLVALADLLIDGTEKTVRDAT